MLLVTVSVLTLILQSSSGQFDFDSLDDLRQIQKLRQFGQPWLGQNNLGRPNTGLGAGHIPFVTPPATATALPPQQFDFDSLDGLRQIQKVRQFGQPWFEQNNLGRPNTGPGAGAIPFVIPPATATALPPQQFDFDSLDGLRQIQKDRQFGQPWLGQNNVGRSNTGPGAGPLPVDTSLATTTALPPQFFSCVQRCGVTSQYSPVCGDNDQTYHNLSKLRCAQSCGLNVQMRRSGLCSG